MTIERRGDCWFFDIGINGKRFRGSCKTADQQEAREFHDRKRAQLWRTRHLGDKPRRTWAEASSRWLKEHETLKSYGEAERHLKWWGEEFAKRKVVYLDEVEPDVVKEIREEEAQRVTCRGKIISPTTINRKIGHLRGVINAAAREYRWIDIAPLFRKAGEEIERVRFLRPDELKRLVNALPSPYNDMAMFSVATGLRQGNVRKLKWGHLSPGLEVATIDGKLMKNGAALSIPLNQTARTIIRSYAGQHKEFVFTKNGKPIAEVPTRMWKQTLQKAGITDFRWHDLRHCWASYARQHGMTLDVLQELGGWKSQQMVTRYAHLSVDHLTAHASILDGVLGGVSAVTPQLRHIEGNAQNGRFKQVVGM